MVNWFHRNPTMKNMGAVAGATLGGLCFVDSTCAELPEHFRNYEEISCTSFKRSDDGIKVLYHGEDCEKIVDVVEIHLPSKKLNGILVDFYPNGKVDRGEIKFKGFE